ncbi:11761_t:CDS:1 [Ambispora gerdemannii]|uniref:11761_t:CDS:1 n=1 Tax=Ambispora gerdemannii TaxID=144530 RepID=A0A9N8V2F8_9GLOM|nr:11761_t:CDS:1 [Ambispora gerdemannii]
MTTQQLLAIAGHVYLISPHSGAYKEYLNEDWTATNAGALVSSTQKVYVTTSFNNLWEIELKENIGITRKISWDGWGTCNALVTVAKPGGVTHDLFAFCHKLWLIDDVNTGHCTDFLGGFADLWARVNAAASIGHKIYATTSANNLWVVDTIEKQVIKLGGGWDNWSTCGALVGINQVLYAFCHGLWLVDANTGKYTSFFEGSDDHEGANRSWSDVKCATAIGNNIYVITGSRLVEIDTIQKRVRQVSDTNWGKTKVLLAVDRDVVGDV